MKSERRGKFGKALIFVVLFATLAFVSAGCAFAANLGGGGGGGGGGGSGGDTIYVPEGGNQTIQQAVNNATEGDTIIVRDGTYTENVNVNASYLTIKSENGTASTIVQAANPSDHVFEVTSDYVNISGFTVLNATGDGKSGIHLNGVDYCNISNNNASNNRYGIYLFNSTGNNLTSNEVSLNEIYGVFLTSSSNRNIISKNNVSENKYEVYPNSGIFLEHVFNNTIENNNVSYNGGFGIFVMWGNDTNLSNNSITFNNICGIRIDVSRNIVIHNTLNYNNEDGIFLYDAYDGLIENNTASYNNKSGISVMGGSRDLTIRNNTAKNNSGDGIFHYATHTSLMELNKLENNGINSPFSGGISTHHADNLQIINNSILNNNYGMRNYNLTLSTIEKNNLSNNTNCGIYLDFSNSNLIYNNYFDNTNNAWDNGNNIWNVTKTTGTNIIGGHYLGGNYWGDYAGTDANGDGLGDNRLPYNSNGNIFNGGDYHPLVPEVFAPVLSIEKSDNPDPVPLGSTLHYSIHVNNTGYANATNVTVTETYDANMTFVVAAPAPSQGNDTWIFPTLNVSETKWVNISVTVNSSIPNGTVLYNFVNATCDEGVPDSDVEDTTVFVAPLALNCTCGDICVNETGWWRDSGDFNASGTPIQHAVDNAAKGETICVKDGTYTENVDVDKRLTIRSENGSANCVVNASDSNDHVFEVTANSVGINGFTIENAIQDEKAGIYLSGRNHCSISDNNVTNNYYGIFLYYSGDNTITNNTANKNSEYGICLHYSSNNTLTGNTANENHYGIRLDYSSNNTLTGNTANENHYGIYLDYSSNNNTLMGNTANSNYNCDGIYLGSSDNNNLTNNTANSNTKNGIWLDSSSNNTLENNTANENNYGIRLGSSSNNTLENNTANKNDDYGIYLDHSSNNNTLAGNTANSNYNCDGIYLSSSDNNNLTNNTVNENNYGIRLYSSSNNTLTNNTANENDDYGIWLGSSSNNLIYNNYFNNTNNAYDDGNNIWNIAKTAGTNILGGEYLGGNYWSDYAGEDTDGDGLGDTMLPYNSSGNIANGGDYLPLVKFAPSIFDTGPGTYPSIMGLHTGKIRPNKTIIVHKMYTYPCVGTGGHTEYVRFYGTGLDVNKTWNGYIGDYHYIIFNPPIALQANTTYDYEIRTGSYPQIIHEQSFPTANGTINCTQFTDANGRTYDNGIPAIRLE